MCITTAYSKFFFESSINHFSLSIDEEIARAQRTAVRRDPREADVAADEATGDHARGRGGVHHARAVQSRSAARVSCASEKGRRTPPASW